MENNFSTPPNWRSHIWEFIPGTRNLISDTTKRGFYEPVESEEMLRMEKEQEPFRWQKWLKSSTEFETMPLPPYTKEDKILDSQHNPPDYSSGPPVTQHGEKNNHHLNSQDLILTALILIGILGASAVICACIFLKWRAGQAMSHETIGNCQVPYHGPYKPMTLDPALTILGLCRHINIALILQKGMFFSLDNISHILCPENVRAIDIFGGISAKEHFLSYFNLFPKATQISFVGPMDCNPGVSAGMRNFTKIRLNVSTLRFVDLNNCRDIYQTIYDTLDMPCLKNIEFDCVSVGPSVDNIVKTLINRYPTVNMIECSGDDKCKHMMQYLVENNNVTVQLKFRNC